MPVLPGLGGSTRGRQPEPAEEAGSGTAKSDDPGEVLLLRAETAALQGLPRTAGPDAGTGPEQGAETRGLILDLLRHKRISGGGLYFFVQILQKGVALLLIPLYTKYLTPEQYGIIATCAAMSAAIGFAFCLCIYEKAYFALVGNEPDARGIVASILWTELALAVVLPPLALAVAFMGGLGTIAGVQFFPYVFYTVLSAIASTVVNTYLLTLQAKDRIGRCTLASFLVFAAFTCLNVYLLVPRRLEALSYVYAGAVVYGAAGLLAAAAIWREYGARPSLAQTKKALAFGIPLVPHNAAHWARGNVDRILLSSLLSTAQTGIYGMATAYGSVLFMATEAFRLVNNPRFFALMRDPNANREKIAAMLPLSIAALSGLALVVSMFARDVFRLLLAPVYWDAYKYVPLVAVSWLVYAIYINTVNVLFHQQRTDLVSVATVGGAAFGTGATWLLVSRFGAWGSAGGLVVLNACIAGLVMLMVRRRARLPWPWPPTLIACAAPAVCYVGGMNGQWPLAPRAAVAVAILGAELLLMRRYLRVVLRVPSASSVAALGR